MGLNLAALAKILAFGKLDLDTALRTVNTAITLMEAAEDVYAGLKGNEKLQIVTSGALAVVRASLPDEAETFFTDVAKRLAPIVSLLVTLYNLKSLWPRPKPS